MQNSNKRDSLHTSFAVLSFLKDAAEETLHGLKTNTVPWALCFSWGTITSLFVGYDVDRAVLISWSLGNTYPSSMLWFSLYSLTMSFSGVLVWGFYRASLKRRLLSRLTNVFQSIGLKNSLGMLPSFIFDRPIDEHTRVMRLGRKNLPKTRFEESKAAIEGSLQVYVDEMRENRERGTIDIVYAHKPMPALVEMNEVSLKKHTIIVGATRSGPIEVSIKDIPHLLVAGQTGGGKSTCLRQWITTLLVSNPTYKFTLIDLKGGLEFQTFEGIKAADVIPDINGAVRKLRNLAVEMEERKQILKENGSKDIDAFSMIPSSARRNVQGLGIKSSFDRKVIVIDEIAELFLSSGGADAKSIQAAREATSKISRQGRAVGLHLIVGTQRPDAKALDTQIKANLVGKICFQMADQHSSLVVLGNVRAKNLPPIAGRAIWQNGLRQTEVQMPYLSIDKTEKLLSHLKAREVASKSELGSRQ